MNVKKRKKISELVNLLERVKDQRQIDHINERLLEVAKDKDLISDTDDSEPLFFSVEINKD